MTQPTAVLDAFAKLVFRLEQLYGTEHNHDFQKELDALEAEIKKPEVADVSNDKTSRGQAPSEVVSA